MARGTVRKRSKDTYEIRWDEPNKDGKRQQKSKTVKGTKRAAEAELNRIEADLAKSPAERASEIPVAEFAEFFLKERADVDLRPNSVRNYKGFFRNYLSPVCGEMPLASVKGPVLQSVIRSMIDARLAPSTIQSRAGLMKGLFNWAVEKSYLPATPAEKLTVPKCSGESSGQMLSGPEVVDLLAAFEGTPGWLPAFLAVHTGMRPGEILALSWDDVDLDRGTLSVRHTMTGISDNSLDYSLDIGPAKTSASFRTVAVSPEVVQVLREVKQQMPEYYWILTQVRFEGHLERAVAPVDFRQVCAQPGGGILVHKAWTAIFSSTLCRAGLRKIRLHDLRHTHASLLLLDGVPIHVVSKRLGHANIATTIKIYGHLLPSSDPDAALRLAAILRKPA